MLDLCENTPVCNSKWKWFVLAVLYGTVLWLGFFYIIDVALIYIKGDVGRQDWHIFSDQAMEYLKSGRLYADDLTLYYPSAAIYKFPPFFDAALIFFYELGVMPEAAKNFVGILNVILYIASVILLLLAFPRQYLSLPLLLVFVFTSGALENNLNSLQLEIYILFLTSSAIILFSKNKFWWGGVMIGIAAGLKIYPIFFCFGAITKNRRVLYGVLSGIFVTVGISILIVSPYDHFQYFFRILPSIFSENISLYKDNTSLGYLLVSLFGYEEKYASQISDLIFYGTLGLVFFNGLYYKITCSYNRFDVRGLYVIFSEICLLVAVFLLASKNVWLNYQLLLLIPVFGFILLSFNSKKSIPIAAIAFCILCFLMRNWTDNEVMIIKNFLVGISKSEALLEELFYFPYLRSFASVIVYACSVFLYVRIVGVFSEGSGYVQGLRRD